MIALRLFLLHGVHFRSTFSPNKWSLEKNLTHSSQTVDPPQNRVYRVTAIVTPWLVAPVIPTVLREYTFQGGVARTLGYNASAVSQSVNLLRGLAGV